VYNADAMKNKFQWLPDSSGKPTAEAFVQMVCGEDLQRIAGTEVEKCTSVHSP